MEGLRIAPQGQGQYKNAVQSLNDTFHEEEVWPVNVNSLVKNIPVGDSNSEEEYQNLTWANKPKPKPRFANKVKKNRSRRNRSNRKNTTRRNRSRRNRN